MQTTQLRRMSGGGAGGAPVTTHAPGAPMFQGPQLARLGYAPLGVAASAPGVVRQRELTSATQRTVQAQTATQKLAANIAAARTKHSDMQKKMGEANERLEKLRTQHRSITVLLRGREVEATKTRARASIDDDRKREAEAMVLQAEADVQDVNEELKQLGDLQMCFQDEIAQMQDLTEYIDTEYSSTFERMAATRGMIDETLHDVANIATNRIGMMEEDRFACEKAFIARQREAGELAAQMAAVQVTHAGLAEALRAAKSESKQASDVVGTAYTAVVETGASKKKYVQEAMTAEAGLQQAKDLWATEWNDMTAALGERRSAAAASEAASDAATSRLADDEKEAQVAQQELSQSTSQLADLEKAADTALLRQQEVERVAVATRARHAAAATKLQALEATLRQREGDLTRKSAAQRAFAQATERKNELTDKIQETRARTAAVAAKAESAAARAEAALARIGELKDCSAALEQAKTRLGASKARREKAASDMQAVQVAYTDEAASRASVQAIEAELVEVEAVTAAENSEMQALDQEMSDLQHEIKNLLRMKKNRVIDQEELSAVIADGSVQTLVKHYEDHAAVVQKDTNEKCAQIKEEEISQKQAYATKMQSIIKRQQDKLRSLEEESTRAKMVNAFRGPAPATAAAAAHVTKSRRAQAAQHRSGALFSDDTDTAPESCVPRRKAAPAPAAVPAGGEMRKAAPAPSAVPAGGEDDSDAFDVMTSTRRSYGGASSVIRGGGGTAAGSFKQAAPAPAGALVTPAGRRTGPGAVLALAASPWPGAGDGFFDESPLVKLTMTGVPAGAPPPLAAPAAAAAGAKKMTFLGKSRAPAPAPAPAVDDSREVSWLDDAPLMDY